MTGALKRKKRKTMKSRFALGAAILAIALVATGCSPTSDSSSGSGGSETLEFATNLAAGGTALTELTKVTKEFEAAHPGVKINISPGTATYEADIKVRLASGNLPDLWSTHGWSLIRYSDFLLPLNKEAWAKNFNPALSGAMKNSKGQFFAYPVNTDIAGIVYNKTVLKDAGVDPSTLTTWDKFTEASKKIKAAGVIPISASGKDSWFAGYFADWLSPGAYSESDLKSLQDGKYKPAGYEKVLDQVTEWQKAGLFNPDYSSAVTDDLAKALANGTTAFVLSPNDLPNNALTFNPKAELGYIPIPGFDEGEQYFVGGEGQAYGIWKDSKHLETAKAYIAFLAEPKNTSALAGALGSIPGLTDATSDLGILQDSYDTYVKDGKYPLVPYFDRVYLPNGMWDTLVSTSDAVITGTGTAADGATQATTAFDSLYGQK
jgi:raffinose/stachyose/melibiose transport system substrate-binding protein